MERTGLAQFLDGQTRGAWDGFAITMFASAVLLVLVTLFPSLDLVTARQFYSGRGHFLGEGNILSYGLRNLFIAFYLVACAVCLAGLVITRDRVRSFLSLGFMKWLFLALCISIGPGVVANLALKDQSGRARPSQGVPAAPTAPTTRDRRAPRLGCARHARALRRRRT